MANLESLLFHSVTVLLGHTDVAVMNYVKMSFLIQVEISQVDHVERLTS